LLAEADYVICIDAIGQGTELNLHVSKPPKEGTQAYTLIQVCIICCCFYIENLPSGQNR